MTRLITPERWRRLEPLVDLVLERSPGERSTLLAQLDADTRRQVEELIARCDVAVPLLETPAAERFADLIADPEPLPSILGDRYHVNRVIGRGGMATVYLARDVRHDRMVAVKVLSGRVSAVVARERFLAEIRIAARLTHPHIVGVHDSGETDGHLFYVMPYVEGETLRERLRRESALSVDEALGYTREIADALGHAHRNGVIHRDVKPENVLLESGHAVVADFGIARAIDLASTHVALGWGATGTPTYMSPEQATGATLDQRSDVYSLGCVLFEMLTGSPPFVGPDVDSVVRQHRTATAPLVSTRRPGVPAAVGAAVARALAKEPADRFSDILAFSEALTATPSRSSGVTRADRSRIGRFGLTPMRITGLVAGLVGAVVFARPWQTPEASERYAPTRIAVMPFEYVGTDDRGQAIARGLHEVVRMSLSRVAALSVIHRRSLLAYERRTVPAGRVAEELGVGSLLEGRVQVIDRRLRATVRLIDPTTGKERWSRRYDRTMGDVSAIQRDIATEIVRAVGAEVTSAESEQLAVNISDIPEAYESYLQGMAYSGRLGADPRNWEIAQRFFERALDIDSTFAEAYAALSEIHGRMRNWRYDASPSRAAAQRAAADAATRLDSSLAQAHFAQALVHLWGGGHDYARALEELRAALTGSPGDAQVWTHMASVHRRLGQWDLADSAFRVAAVLDPRAADLINDLGGHSYRMRHQYADAIRYYDRALELGPDLHVAAVSRGWSYVALEGRLDSLRTALKRVPANAALGMLGDREAQRVKLLLWERRSDSLLQYLAARDSSPFTGQQFFVPPALYVAWAHRLRGNEQLARSAFQSARRSLSAWVARLPDDPRVHAALGLALAGLGRRDEALDEAQWLAVSAIYRKDHYFGPSAAEDRARILVQAGAIDSALAEVMRLLVRPSGLNVNYLRLDPLWDPARSDPRFVRLVGNGATGRLSDASASTWYDQGRYHLASRTTESRMRAVSAFEQAARIDPLFAAAHARLAEAYANVAYFGYPNGPRAAEAFDSAEAALSRAMAIDPSRPEVWLSLAKLRWMHAPDLQAAEQAIHRALRRDSSAAEAHFEHARILAMRGEADSAILEMNVSRSLDPGAAVRHADIAWVYWVVRRYADAERIARQALEVDSTSTAFLALGGALMGDGKYAEGVAAFEEGLRRSRGNRLLLAQLGHALARTGRYGDAVAVLDSLRRFHARGLASSYYIAQVHLGLDQKDSALHWLEMARMEGAGHLAFLRANAAWDPLRGSPRFEALVRSVGLR